MKRISKFTIVLILSAIGYFNVSNTNTAYLTLLDDIKTIAFAEVEQGTTANICCPIWNISYSPTYPWPTIICTTGGNYKCDDCTCPG